MTHPLAERLASRHLQGDRAERLAARYLQAESFSTMRALAKKWVAKSPELGPRMERALALTGGVEEVSPSTFTVEGEGGTYTVMINRSTKVSTCDCPDSRRGNKCKHRLACALVEAAKKKDDTAP